MRVRDNPKLPSGPDKFARLLFPDAGYTTKQRGHAVECHQRLGGLLKFYGRAACVAAVVPRSVGDFGLHLGKSKDAWFLLHRR